MYVANSTLAQTSRQAIITIALQTLLLLTELCKPLVGWPCSFLIQGDFLHLHMHTVQLCACWSLLTLQSSSPQGLLPAYLPQVGSWRPWLH